MSYNAKNYTEQGGEVTHIGGKLEIVSGATLIVDEGATVTGIVAEVPEADLELRGTVFMARNQLASEAETVEELVEDFNALLAKLKQAGIMVTDR